ncbi:Signal recognition particle protein, partial [Tetrabaena socialis]
MSVTDKRIVVYPQYIDVEKTVAEGRRLPKDKACGEPFVDEMHDCCKLLNLESVIE